MKFRGIVIVALGMLLAGCGGSSSGGDTAEEETNLFPLDANGDYLYNGEEEIAAVEVRDLELAVETIQPATADSRLPWNSAKARCESLTLAGSGDWRLPTVSELAALQPTMTGRTDLFGEVRTYDYWSGDVYTFTVGDSSTEPMYKKLNFATGSQSLSAPTTAQLAFCVRDQ